MEVLKDFLESSTIHGLGYISTSTSKVVKVFWFLIVLSGFITAGFLIHQSFSDWEANPVSTTISIHPISGLRFPKVTVCPPHRSNTALNHDLLKTNISGKKPSTLIDKIDKIFETGQRGIKSKRLMSALSPATIKNMYYGYESVPVEDEHYLSAFQVAWPGLLPMTPALAREDTCHRSTPKRSLLS